MRSVATILGAFAVMSLLAAGPSMAQDRAPVLSTGSVVAKNSAVLSAKIMSFVEKIHGDVGAPVRKGQVLIELDSAELEANRLIAAARLEDAMAVLENAKANHDRMKALIEKGATTQSAYDNAVMAYRRAEAGVALAEAEVRKAEVFLGYTKVRSPISGKIDFKRTEVGELTAPGRPLLKVTDDKNLRFETTVKESDINRIKTGQRVSILIDALPGRGVDGTVAHIVPSGDSVSHSFTVRIDLKPANGLMIGMYGKVRWR